MQINKISFTDYKRLSFKAEETTTTALEENTNKETGESSAVVSVKTTNRKSSKNVLLTLGILASLGVATTAMVKNKNLKKELGEELKKLKKAEDKAKEAEKNAKNTISEIKKALEELKTKNQKSAKNNNVKKHKQVQNKTNRVNNAPQENRKEVINININNPEKTVTIVSEPSVKKEGFLSRLKNKIGKFFKKQKSPKAVSEEKPENKDVRKPLKKKVKSDEEKRIKNSKIGYLTRFKNRIRKFFVRKNTDVTFDVKPKDKVQDKTPKKKEKPSDIERQNDKKGGLFTKFKKYINTKVEARKAKKARKAELKARAEGEKLLDAQEAEKLVQKQASDARNEKWLQEQHDIKEKEYSDMWLKAEHERELTQRAEGEKILDKQEARKLKKKQASDARNEKWLQEQHDIKEKEYSDMWLKAEHERELTQRAEGEKILEKQEARKLKKKQASDARNEKWLQKQHDIKEKEYSDMWLNAERERELAQRAEGEKYLDKQEAIELKKKRASDKRNRRWLKKQHNIKEKEYSAMWLNAERERELAQRAEGEKILDKQEARILRKKQASDARNEKWLKKQHKIKEKEYSDMWLKAEHEKASEEAKRKLEEEEAYEAYKRHFEDKHSWIRNEKWLQEQHDIKEKEYSDMWLKAERERELAQRAEGERILDKQEARMLKKKQASDARNEKWLQKQHDIKEKEYSDMWLKAERERELAQRAEGERILDRQEAEKLAQKQASDARNEEWLKRQHRSAEIEYSQWWNNELNKYRETPAINALPQSFNEEMLESAKKIGIRRIDETTFKTYPSPVENKKLGDRIRYYFEKRKARKAIERNKREIIRKRRIQGCADPFNIRLILDSQNYSKQMKEAKYKEILKDAVNGDLPYKPMSREDFMANKDKYIQEYYEFTKGFKE